MILSKRERVIIFAAAAAAMALAIDRFALNPLLAGWSQTDARKKTLVAEMNRARATLRLSQEMKPRWQAMMRAGIKGEPSGAESQILHAIRDWAEQSGVSLSLLKPDRLTDKTPLPEIDFQASGSGSMESVAGLLWRMENAEIPIRITELQLASRKEGSDDLSFQLRLSTVYLAGGTPTSQTANTSGPTGAEP